MPFSDREKHREWERNYLRKDRQARPEYYLWKGAKRRAKAKGLDFDIEVSDIIIPQLCPLLNIPIIHEVGKGHRNPNSPSLDRIIPSKGYVKNNVRVISNRANLLKNNATVEELEMVLDDLKKLRDTTILREFA